MNKVREDYIKEEFNKDMHLDPGSMARGWALHEQYLRDSCPVKNDLCAPMKYRNRETGKIMKVMPLYIPIGEDPRIDFNGLLKDLDLGVNEYLKDRPVYKGLMMQEGYLIENHNRCWLGLFITKQKMDELFENLGPWTEADVADTAFTPDAGA